MSSARPPPRRPTLVTRPFVLVALATLAYFIGENMVLPILPLYVQGPLGGGDVAVGISVGAFSVTALLVRPWAGRVADRRGRRLPMVLGTGIFAVSVFGYLLATSVPVLVMMRLLTGVGEAFMFTGAASAIADMAPEERRGEAISFFSLALWMGIAVGPVIGELAAGGDGFSLVWLLSAGFGVLAGALALRVPIQTVATPEAGKPARLVHPAGLLPGTVVLMSIWGAAGFFAFVPLYARALDLSGSRMVFVVFSAVVLVIRFFGARIPDLMGPIRVARLSLAISALGLCVMGLWSSPTGLFVATAVYAVGQALAFPALLAMALRRAAPSERGAMIGTFSAFVDIGFGIGPAVLGFLAAASGYGAVFLAGSAVALAGLGLLIARARAVVGG